MTTNKFQFLILLMMVLSCFVDGMMPIGSANPQQQLRPISSIEQQQQQDRENKQFLASLRIRALHNLQRSLESLSSLTANSLMLNAALQSSESTEEENQNDEIDNENEIGEEANNTNKLDEATTPVTMRIRPKAASNRNQPPADAPVFDIQQISSTQPSSSSSQHSSSGATSDTNSDELQSIRAHRHGVRRIRADLKQMPPSIQDEAMEMTRTTAEMARGSSGERPTLTRQQRRMRSTNTRHNGHGNHHNGGHHKRRRKGCPTVHGKDQLLCPTRNTHRYDVCITREQLCDRIRDCPGGEDEDSRHCFFFRPLETSLKTISHAVLLLVDTVMREQEEHQQKMDERNEL